MLTNSQGVATLLGATGKPIAREDRSILTLAGYGGGGPLLLPDGFVTPSSGRDSHCRYELETLYTQMMVKRSFPTDMPLRIPQNQGSFSISQRCFVSKRKK